MSAVESPASVAAVVVAAGRGVRAGGAVPKQYRPLLGASPLARTLALFGGQAGIGRVQPVIGADDGPLYAALPALPASVRPPVPGGASRQASVRAGLEALADDPPEVVLIHDAARAFASPDLVTRAIAAGRAGAAIPGVAVSDTIKQVDPGTVTATLDRARLVAVQTPQAFPYALIRELHARAAAAGRDDFTDDAALAEWAGLPVTVFAGEAGNLKLTTDDDFAAAEARLLAALSDVRTGTGFDVHAFAETGDRVVLGGVAIPHTRALAGHSDADVVLHALTDAVLGALGEADIGHHFPPSDARWKGAASDRFLAHAVALVRGRGGLLAHLDVTVVCEAPRVGPHREAMRARIATIADIDVTRVSVKATTSERLGFTGRSEGIAAMASATIRLPWRDR